MFDNPPILIESGTKFFLQETLKKCHKRKFQYNSLIFNITTLILFITSIGSWLFYKYKTKLTSEEKTKKRIKEQEYIMKKLRNFNEQAQKKHNLMITNLPKIGGLYSQGATAPRTAQHKRRVVK